MGEYTLAILTGLMVALIGAVIICILTIRHMKQLRKWEQTAEDNYLLGRDEATTLLRETCDKIAEDRELLAGRSERALLTEILLTLDSHSRRMDRIDDKLKCISHYKTYTGDIQKKGQKLAQGFVILEQDLTAASAAMDALQQTIGESGDRLNGLIAELSGMGKLHQAVSGYASQLGNIELTLEYLQEKTASVVADMENVLDTYDQSPAKRLKTVEMEITGLSLLVNSLHDSVTELSAAADRSSSQLHSQIGELTASVNQLHTDKVSEA